MSRKGVFAWLTLVLAIGAHRGGAQATRSGNPILPGWYADPEAHVFAGEYWIYPTYSARYNEQTFLDAFSSTDLVTWVRHPHILDTATVSWAHRAMWAPSIVEKDGWYYLFFGANDIQNDQQVGGIGVARSRTPDGPFADYLGKPLIGAFHNGAQPIDQMVFRDVDGSYYIVYGGWGHCNIAKLNADFTGIVPLPDGTMFKEITPKGYVEGAFMLIKGGKYYFMWSEGGWTGPDYAVAYAVGTSPFGPFERVGKILQQDSTVATGAGHHSVLHANGSPNWYIVYHRRPLGETDANHRAVSIDELHFDTNGMIEPVVITKAGVRADSLRSPRPAPIALWPNGAPGALGHDSVDIPTISVYRAPAAIATGAAMIICPGGSYENLADHEGHAIAVWLNSQGITGIVLKYRLGPRYHHPAPLLDVARAIRTVRARASEWGIDPTRVGVIGFSAGGHLASTIATHFDAGDATASDPIDRISSRPDVLVLAYPVISMDSAITHAWSRHNLLGDAPSAELVASLSNEKQVTTSTPPTFLFHTMDDPVVPVANSQRFAAALLTANVPYEMHLYDHGPHGVGLATGDPVLSGWTTLLVHWLRGRGFVR